MNKETLENMFIRHAKEYDRAMNFYDLNNYYDRKVRREYYYNLFHNPNTDLIHIYNDTLYVGFLIITKIKNDIYEINEAYIKKTQRNQGFMTRELNNYIKNHHGTYRFDILKGNTIGLKFFDKYFNHKLIKQEIDEEFDWLNAYEVIV